MFAFNLRQRRDQRNPDSDLEGLLRKNHELLAELKEERRKRRALETALLALEGKR